MVWSVAVRDLPKKEQPMATDERWVFGNALNVEYPPGIPNQPTGTGYAGGQFLINTLYSRLTLGESDENWVLAAVPGPNITEYWSVTAVMLRYSFVGGIIDKIVVRDGDSEVYSLENQFIGPTNGWQTATFPISTPTSISFGLGVSLHVTGISAPPGGFNDLRFASIGLAFYRAEAG
jgi:hypothetical protein